MKNHIQSVHEGDKCHKCEMCSKGYHLFSDLRKHMKIVHDLGDKKIDKSEVESVYELLLMTPKIILKKIPILDKNEIF